MTLYPQTVSETNLPCYGTTQATAGVKDSISVPLPCADKYDISVQQIGIRGIGTYSGGFSVTKHQNFFTLYLSTELASPFGEYTVTFIATKI